MMAVQLQDPEAIDEWIRSNWVIVPDPDEAELIRTPESQLEKYIAGQALVGDCDDAATLAASLLLALGYRSILIAIRTPADGSDFSHVFLRIPRPGYVLDIDPIVPAQDLPIRNVLESIEVCV